MMNKEKQIEYVGLDLQLVDATNAVEFVKRTLCELGAPRGSTLEFRYQGVDVTVQIHEGIEPA